MRRRNGRGWCGRWRGAPRWGAARGCRRRSRWCRAAHGPAPRRVRPARVGGRGGSRCGDGCRFGCRSRNNCSAGCRRGRGRRGRPLGGGGVRREGRNVRTGRGVRRSGRSGGELRRWGLLKSRGQFVVGEEDQHRFAVRCELVGVGGEERGDHLLHLFGRERSAGADGGGSG